MASRKTLALAFALLLFGGIAGLGSAAHAQARHLRGTWSLTGTTACINSEVGFNGLQPIVGPGISRYTTSWSVEVVATFNPNGTGTATGRAVAITHTDEAGIIGTGSHSDFQEDFTYVIGPGNLITLTFNNITVNNLSGPRAGQTSTVSQVVLVGHLGVNDQVITAATEVPNVETVTYSAAPLNEFRLCHRSRVFVKN